MPKRRDLALRPMDWRRLRAADWVLVAAVLAAVVYGLAMIYSATLRGEPVTRLWDDLVVKQLVFAGIGFVLMALAALSDYRVLLVLWKWLYALLIGVLVLVPLVGAIGGGAERWFNLGFAYVQPSEFAKIGMILCLAAFFERHDVRRLGTVLGSLALVGVVMALVLIQPDLSTTLLLGFIWLGMAVVAGLRLLHFSILALLGGPALWFMLSSGLVQGYQLTRIETWIRPEADPLGAGYQPMQTLIAVGNGGLFGTGFAQGLQAQGGWLPLMYTDNIFALVAEEMGFVGSAALLVLLAFIVMRIVRAAGLSPDRAGTLICAGVATYLLAQTLVNVGVVLQLLPVTGLSLPFISYGGSSLVTLLLSIGFVQSVLLRRKRAGG